MSTKRVPDNGREETKKSRIAGGLYDYAVLVEGCIASILTTVRFSAMQHVDQYFDRELPLSGWSVFLMNIERRKPQICRAEHYG
jgi:hypothetical protein